MKIIASDGTSPDPLFLHKRSSTSGAITLTLRVDNCEWWAFNTVTVLRAPDDYLVGTQFSNVSRAMGELQKVLEESGGALRYLEQLEACVLGELDDSCLGEEFTHLDALVGEGSVMVQKHSPRLSAQPVQSLREPSESGRWLSAAVLRPFAPHDLSPSEAQAKVVELMRAVSCHPTLHLVSGLTAHCTRV